MPQSMKDVKALSYKHPDSKPLRDLIGKKSLIHSVDVPIFAQERDQALKASYFKVGKQADNAIWYYTTSLVLVDQARIMDHAISTKREPIEATLVEKQTTNGAYLVWE